MAFLEAVRLALQTIRAQKLKSAFSIIGVFIGVMFLIAVVSVVQGMNRYMTDKFAGTILGVNTFRLRQFPGVQLGNVTDSMWRVWARRPRVSYEDAQAVMRSVKFSSTSDDPTADNTRTTRTVTWAATDANSDAVGAKTSAGVTSTIIGARRLAQLEDNLKSVDVNLTSEELGRLDARTNPTLGFPQSLQAFFPAFHSGGTTVNGVHAPSTFVLEKGHKPY